jgi:hypothetical protein
MNEFNKIFGNSFFLKEELKKEEPQRTLIFTWKGLAKDWNLYSEHLKESFRERDEDVRSKIWAN